MNSAFHTHDVVRLVRDLHDVQSLAGGLIDLPKGSGGTIVQAYPDERGHHQYMVEINPPETDLEVLALPVVAHSDIELVWCSDTKSATCSGFTDFVRPARHDSAKHLKRAAGE